MENNGPDDQLAQTAGGAIRSEDDLLALSREFQSRISEDVLASIKDVSTDVEVCEKLAEHGIDVSALEKTLPDEFLARVGGGYEDIYNDTVYCPHCQMSDEKMISYQYLATLYNGRATYRCRKCERTFYKGNYGRMLKQ